MYRILIDGEEAELNPKTKIELGKLLLDLKDFSSRGIKFTNALILPFTNKNDRLCGYPSRLASNNQAFEENQTYQLTDSTGIVSRGDVIIKSFDDKDGIKIQLAEGFNFWTQSGRRKLDDLVNHDDDFVFTTANMNTLKSKSSSVFLTALHAPAGDATDTALSNYSITRPCYYFKSILDKIITELGYSINYGNVLNKTELADIGSLSNADDFFVSDFKRRIEGLVVTGDIDLSLWSPIFSKAGNVSLAGTTLTNTLYKTSYVIKGYVETEVSTQILFTFGSQVERIIVPAGRSLINFRSDEVEIGSTLVISSVTPVLFDDVYVYSAIAEGDIFDIEGAIDITDYLVLSDYNLSQMTYKAFIKMLSRMFFLDFSIDEAKKEINLIYLPDQISVNNATDLSSSVDRGYTVESGSTYGQLNVMSYANDENISQNLGSAFFTVENKNAVETKEFITIEDFSASNEINVSGENVVSVPIYNTTEFTRESITNRMIYFEEVGAFGFNCIFNRISFQRIFSSHYIDFVEATKRERTTNLRAFLTNLQFNDIQRSPVIYVDFLNSHFLVTETKGFKRDSLTNLKVIKYN
jgi:hypothetical protein